jgi:hypothetical protein
MRKAAANPKIFFVYVSSYVSGVRISPCWLCRKPGSRSGDCQEKKFPFPKPPKRLWHVTSCGNLGSEEVRRARRLAAACHRMDKRATIDYRTLGILQQ